MFVRTLFQVAAGVGFPLLTTAVIAQLGPTVRFEFAFLYFPVVLMIAYASGPLAGGVAAVTSTLFDLIFFQEPRGLTLAKARIDILPTLLFLLSATAVVVVGARYRRYQDDLQRDLSGSRRRARNDALILSVADRPVREADLQRFGEAVARPIAEAVADWAAIVLLDPNAVEPVLSGLHVTDGEDVRERFGRELTAAQLGALVAPERAADLAPFAVTESEFLARYRLASALVAPLTFGDDRLGYLIAFSKRRRDWDDEDRRVMRELAARLAQATHRGRLLRQRSLRARHTQFLSEIMVEFARQHDADILLETIVRRCTDVLGEWCAVARLDAQTGALRLAATHHRDPDRLRAASANPPSADMAADDPFWAEIIKSGKPFPVVFDDPKMSETFTRLPGLKGLADGYGLRRALLVPMYAGDEPLGVLAVGMGSPGVWDSETLSLSGLIADRAAVAMENLRLIASERQQRQVAEHQALRTRTINRIIGIAASSLDLGQVFDELGDALQGLVPFVRLTVSLLDADQDRMVMPYFKGPARMTSAELLEGPKAGTARGWVIDHGDPFIREDTYETREYAEDMLLARSGVRSYLIVPMLVGGNVVGTLNFGHDQPGTYTIEHARLAQPIAYQLALTLSRLQLFQQVQERAGRLSETLQRALLPADLPSVPFASIGALYRPADPEAKIGGDWYDAFLLPDDTLLIGIGDVAGHGTAAAAAMGQVRHIVRAYALEGCGSGEITRRTNEFLCRLPDSLQLSMWLGILDPYSGELVYSGAGHPPVLLLADGEINTLAPNGPPLGVFPGRGFEVKQETVPPRGRLVAYTDGLIEATRNILEGERRLLEAMRSTQGQPPDTAADALVAAVLNDAVPADDIAVLIFDRLPQDSPLIFRLPARPENLRRVRRAVRAFAARVALPPEMIEPVVMAVGEASLNVVEHAYVGLGGEMSIQAERHESTLRVTVMDTGQWRSQVERGRGRGNRIIEGFTDQVRTSTGPAGTIVELNWAIPASQG